MLCSALLCELSCLSGCSEPTHHLRSNQRKQHGLGTVHHDLGLRGATANDEREVDDTHERKAEHECAQGAALPGSEEREDCSPERDVTPGQGRVECRLGLGGRGQAENLGSYRQVRVARGGIGECSPPTPSRTPLTPRVKNRPTAIQRGRHGTSAELVSGEDIRVDVRDWCDEKWS